MSIRCDIYEEWLIGRPPKMVVLSYIEKFEIYPISNEKPANILAGQDRI